MKSKARDGTAVVAQVIYTDLPVIRETATGFRRLGKVRQVAL